LQPGPLKTTRFAQRFVAPVVAVLLGACATTYQPQPLVLDADLQGVQTTTIDDVTVSVAMLTDEQAQTHFGADFAKSGLQGLYIKVRNETHRRLWFIRNTVDPDFYSPDEAAVLLKGGLSETDFDALRQHLRDESIRVQHQPLTITEGFLYLPRVEGGRYVDIRLGGDVYETDEEDDLQAGWLNELRFGFAVPLPDGLFDYEKLDPAHTYGDVQLPDIDDPEALRQHLEDLPCCAMDNDGENFGDPLNVVLIGDSADALSALTRAGWSFTHRISLATVRRLAGAALSGDAYPVAPVSNLYLFDRKQDFALQRARPTISQRNHSRFWLAPYTFRGRQVWIGQVSRDIGVKLTANSPSLTTHVIDPEVDLTREYLLHSLLDAGLVSAFGFVKGSTFASREEPAVNLANDPYFSDGLRLVIALSPHPRPYHEVRSMRWEQSSAPAAEGQTESAERYVRPLEPE
jgi:hypothetical protein